MIHSRKENADHLIYPCMSDDDPYFTHGATYHAISNNARDRRNDASAHAYIHP